jgi:hypothetical protein
VCLGFIEFCPSAKFDRADEADIAGRAAKCAASGAFAAEADASAREAPYPQRRARKATGRARRAAVSGGVSAVNIQPRCRIGGELWQ